jgi:hypothetical protein
MLVAVYQCFSSQTLPTILSPDLVLLMRCFGREFDKELRKRFLGEMGNGVQTPFKREVTIRQKLVNILLKECLQPTDNYVRLL